MDALDRSRLVVAASAFARPVMPSAALLDAWRQLHYAAQVASEVGKAWAPPQADDSHSSFGWQDGCLVGAWAPAARRFRASLRARDLELALVDEAGTALARRALSGSKLDEAMAWVRDAALRAAGGPARQPAAPAPELPPHPIAAGAPFALEPAPFAELARLLAAANTVLCEVAKPLGAGAVRVWPHHFDMAALAAVEERRGAATKTLGVGLATPDAIAGAGYWYASPWAAREPASALRWPPLECGRWIERGAALRMAALPLDELAAAAAGPAALAGFLADAVAACRASLG